MIDERGHFFMSNFELRGDHEHYVLPAKSVKSDVRFDVYDYEQIPSTNSIAMLLAMKETKPNICITTRWQTDGRGRMGKHFYSPKGTGLYFTLIYRNDTNIYDALMITPAVACAVASVLAEESGKEMGIKWVNDIYCNGKKVCGILTESSIDFENVKLNHAIIGVGINLTKPKLGFVDEIEDIAGVVFDKPLSPTKKKKLLEKLLLSMDKYLKMLSTCEFMDEYRRRSILIGKEVVVQNGRGKFEAKVLGIDNRAGLVVEASGDCKVLQSGEVSIKMPKATKKTKSTKA